MGRGGMRLGAGRPAHKGKAEACQRIDVRQWAKWAKREMLEPGYSGYWYWPNTTNRDSAGCVQWSTEAGAVVLRYSLADTPRTDRVPLVTTACRYGGARPWFLCPRCGRRVAVLYLRNGGFRCRPCARVSYASQCCDAIGRGWRAQAKAEARLGLNLSRPKGMHWTTFDKEVAVIFRCEAQREEALERFLAGFGGLI